jgi:hypothetical protein
MINLMQAKICQRVLPVLLLAGALTACGGGSAPAPTATPVLAPTATAVPGPTGGGNGMSGDGGVQPTPNVTGSGADLWRKAVAAMKNVKSMHIEIPGDKPENTLAYDLDGNDKMRTTGNGTTMLVIGDTGYMQQSDGKWIKLSSSEGATATPDTSAPSPIKNLTELFNDVDKVDDAGDSTLDGVAAHHLKATYTLLGTGWQYDVWTAKDTNYILQTTGSVVSGGQTTAAITVKYSKFNEIHLEAPAGAEDLMAGISATLTAGTRDLATQMAAPTATEVPTDTPEPTATEAPTDTPEPTATEAPTDTPTP